MIFPKPLLTGFIPVAMLLLPISSADGAEKTFQWFRFKPLRQRDTPPTTLVQISEIRFLSYGTPLDLGNADAFVVDGSSPDGEGPEYAIDGDVSTKWLDFTMQPLVVRFPEPVGITGYGFTTANDATNRDPGNWRLEGSHDGIQWVLLDEQINASVPTSRYSPTQDFLLPQTVPPYSSFWHPEGLLRWTPEDDTASEFNRSFVPLRPRTVNETFKKNPHARLNEGGVTILSAFAPTSYTPSQGSRVQHYNAYSGWQYTDKLVFWGGSAGEGLILAPSAPIIDAAHRNGVPVLGTIFFPPTAYGGQFGFVDAMLQKDEAAFPVADKLIEMTRHYGFDGWFINQETAGGNSSDAGDMRDFISYFRSQAPDLEVQWYDAMTEGGFISWQNALTSSNDMFLRHNGNPVADSMFLNFWWSSSGLTNSRNLAISQGIDPYDVYAGVDFESGGYDASIDWSAIFPEGQAHKLSLAFYGQQAVFNHSGNPEQFQDRELLFFSGQNDDPSQTSSSSNWKGMAHYFPATTPVQSLPFVTNFNRGQGNSYHIDGTKVASYDWSNLSTQDVLPTWRWVVRSDGTKLTPTLRLGDAFYGGTSLVVEGNLNATNDIDLFASKLPITSQTRGQVVFKTGTSGTPSRMQLALTFDDAPNTPVYFSCGSTRSSGWTSATFNLGGHAGRTVGSIGLRFSSPTTTNGYSIKIGRLAFYDGSIVAASPASNLRVVQSDMLTADTFSVRLAWDPSPTSDIYYYNIFQRFPDNSRRYLGTTSAHAYYVPDLERAGNETIARLEVEAVGSNFGTSRPIQTSFSIPQPDGFDQEVTGVHIGTEGSWENRGDTGDKAFDNIPGTFFDAPTINGSWTGLDFGPRREKRITGIRYMPRNGWATRMKGGVFQGANNPDFSDAVTLFTVTDTPANGEYTSIPIGDPRLFRYFRYADDPNCNVAEIDVFGWGMPFAPGNAVARRFTSYTELSWNPASGAQTYRIESATTPSGPFSTLADGVISTNFTEPVSGTEPRYYRVTTRNPAGESPASTMQIVQVGAFESWQVAAFGDSTDIDLIGADADADHDGVPNLLEFVLKLDPTTPDAPAWEMTRDESGFSLRFRTPAVLTGTAVSVECSENLSQWSTSGLTLQSESIDPETREFHARVGLNETGRCFLRIVATQE